MSIFADEFEKTVKLEGEEFVLRRISVADQFAIDEAVKASTNRLQAGLSMLITSLKSWSVKAKDGKPLPINEENIKRMRIDVMNVLLTEALKLNQIAEEDLKNSQARPDSLPKATG